MKIPFFVLLEGLERVLSDRIRGLITDNNLSTLVKSNKRAEELKQKMEGLKEDSADRDWATVMSFREVLEVAVAFRKVDLKIKDIEALAAVRNDVFHAVSKRELVESHKDVRRLREVRDLCISILHPHQFSHIEELTT